MKITIAGTGYVGLVTGVCLAKVGHNVTCVDVNEEKVEKLKNGILPIYEEGLEELLVETYSNKKIDFTTDFKKAYKEADVIFIGVGTPEKEDGSADLSYVFNVCSQIAESVENNCLVVIKSTVPIGTNEKIEKYFEKITKKDIKIEVASNPEFLSQGTAVKDTLEASRIVIGVESKKSEKVLRKIYTPFNIPIVSTDRRSAELIKYASNNFLAMKISFINEMANLCELLEADINDVVKGMSFDDRIGRKFLKAGIGYGGSCFPKDTKALCSIAEDVGYKAKIIEAIIKVNEKQRYTLLEKAKKRFGSLKGKKVAVLGLTFKPNTDDLRDSPAIYNINKLLEEEADIVVYDPVALEKVKRIYSNKIKYETSPYTAISNADIAFIFTEWKEIKEIKTESYQYLMKEPVVFDGRNCYKLDKVRNGNIEYYSIGRQEINNIRMIDYEENIAN